MVTLSAFADEISPVPEEQLDVLDSHGIKHIEFRSIHGTNVLDLSSGQHEAFRALMDSRGFSLSAIGSPIGKIPITDPFGPHLERFRRAMDLADFYRTPRIRIFSYYIPKEDDPASYREEVLSRMREKARLAEGRNISLVLENERYIYGDRASRVLDVLQSVDSPALSHAFDPANYAEIHQPIEEAWRLLRSRTSHFHVKDYDPKTQKNVPTGEGAGMIPELIADAVEHGFRGFCVLEPHLLISELTHGFTGPERFGDAVVALKDAMTHRRIPYQ